MTPLRTALAGVSLLRHATLPGCVLDPPLPGLVRRNLRLAGSQVAAVEPAGPGDGPDVRGSLVLPGLVDMHTHLDKGHIWPRAPNPDGTHRAAIAAVQADREAHWTTEDVLARADFALRCAYAHGTVAIRTHLDSAAPQAAISWPAFRQLRAAWAGRIALQAVALQALPLYAGPDGDALADLVAESGGVLGGTIQSDPDGPRLIRRVFDLAAARGLAVDLHVDETGDPASALLRTTAEETIRRGWQGRVTCGHCCSLANQPEPEAARTIALVAAAGITVVSLPIVNMYLQGRAPGRTPRWRGVTLLHELRAAGVRIALASDNTRDPFHAAGDLDMVEVLREGVRIAHLDLPVDDWALAVGAAPAAAMGLALGRIAAGTPADLVVFPAARDWSELLSRPHADRIVLRAGVPIDAALPDYRELDRLTPGRDA